MSPSPSNEGFHQPGKLKRTGDIVARSCGDLGQRAPAAEPARRAIADIRSPGTNGGCYLRPSAAGSGITHHRVRQIDPASIRRA